MCCPHFAAFYHHARQGALYPETINETATQCLSVGFVH
jgi:hypothetical protein